MKRILFLLLAAMPAFGQIQIHEYLNELERLQQYLATSQLDRAQEQARTLSALEIDSPQGRFHADTSLLLAIADAKRADVQLQSRLAVTIDEIRRVTPGAHAPADPKLLARVAGEQEVPELAPGGEFGLKEVPQPPLLQRIAQSLERVWDWILDKLNRILEWILDFFPDNAREPGATGGMRWIVAALVATIVILIVILALESRRRARKKSKTDLETSEPLGSKRDDDPLSRGASEWERYAAQLAQTGRFREAIRAWYHAALVSCYAAGVLHFRKSRTNWEYIAALAPSHDWRPEFITLTRRFEREWYGASQSSIDAYDDCHRRARTVIDSVRGSA
ncbi:MAG TPA: DUF4129 domain-containing protein [Thermoanaerobaculia bacterium]|nr:DUF4129 domain-containing protein [Thermoanaerobaculia bacterium]